MRRQPNAIRPPSHPFPEWLALILCLAAALGMRLAALRFQPFVTVDGTEYVRFAEALREGRLFASIFPPGYPALIAAARGLVSDRVFAAQLVSLVAGTLMIWPVWLLARRAVGPRWAALPALAVALHPELARFSAVVMSESAHLLALYGGVALATTPPGWLAGLAFGEAFAIRPEAIIPAAALAVLAAVRVARRALPARTLVLASAGFLILALPCWLYFHATLGAWTLTPKVGALRETVTDWRTDEPRLAARSDSIAGAASLAPLARAGRTALAQYPSNAIRHGRSLLGMWPLPLLALSVLGLWRRRGIESIPLVVLLGLPLLGLSQQPRFVLVAVPALAVLATVPLATESNRARRLALITAWVVGALWCGISLAPNFRSPMDGWPETHARAGLWLSGVAERDAVVMDRKPYVAFYAGREYRVMPDEPYETLVRHAVESGTRYLVVDQKVAEVYRRQLEPLLYDAAFRDRETRLELIYVGGREVGRGVGLFAVLRPGETKRGRPPFIDAEYLPRSKAP